MISATETQRLSNVVKREQWSELAFCRKALIVNEATAKTYRTGEVLGLVTATQKGKIAVESAVDGSKVFHAICLEDKTVPATTDTAVLVMFRGDAAVNKAGLYLDATYNDDTKKGVIYTAIEAARIELLEAV